MSKFSYNEIAEISESFFKLLCLDLNQSDMFSGIWVSDNLLSFDMLFPVKLTLDDMREKYELAAKVLSNLDAESVSLRLIKGDGVHYIAVKTWIE
ncbi:MAG: hypothetical protein PHC95_08970 [Parabacteroides sp.]|nr:hypothetical protein [Parabacteroides sp.]